VRNALQNTIVPATVGRLAHLHKSDRVDSGTKSRRALWQMIGGLAELERILIVELRPAGVLGLSEQAPDGRARSISGVTSSAPRGAGAWELTLNSEASLESRICPRGITWSGRPVCLRESGADW
jgi:hypothetical protein